MKNQAAGGGYKNESFFNNFFQCGRFHMSRHILLLNPTLIFKGLFFPFACRSTLIIAKHFAHMLLIPGKAKFVWALPCSSSQNTLLPTSVTRQELSSKLFSLQFHDETVSSFIFRIEQKHYNFSTWLVIKSLTYYLLIKM